MTECKFGEEVEGFVGAGEWEPNLRFAGVSPSGCPIAADSQGGARKYSAVRRPRKLVKARFQPMIFSRFDRPIMVDEDEIDAYVNGDWRKVGNVIEIEVDISEASNG